MCYYSYYDVKATPTVLLTANGYKVHVCSTYISLLIKLLVDCIVYQIIYMSIYLMHVRSNLIG